MNTLQILNNNDDINLSTAELFYNRYKKYMQDYRQLNPKKWVKAANAILIN